LIANQEYRVQPNDIQAPSKDGAFLLPLPEQHPIEKPFCCLSRKTLIVNVCKNYVKTSGDSQLKSRWTKHGSMTKILDQQSRFQKSLSLWESRRLSGGEGVHACHAKLLIHKTADSQNC
jgi:hypothetical protein